MAKPKHRVHRPDVAFMKTFHIGEKLPHNVPVRIFKNPGNRKIDIMFIDNKLRSNICHQEAGGKNSTEI